MVAVHIVPCSPAMRLPALSCWRRGGRFFILC
nr:MAG TPA: Nuclease [Caudoviricetes sp.]